MLNLSFANTSNWVLDKSIPIDTSATFSVSNNTATLVTGYGGSGITQAIQTSDKGLRLSFDVVQNTGYIALSVLDPNKNTVFWDVKNAIVAVAGSTDQVVNPSQLRSPRLITFPNGDVYVVSLGYETTIARRKSASTGEWGSYHYPGYLVHPQGVVDQYGKKWKSFNPEFCRSATNQNMIYVVNGEMYCNANQGFCHNDVRTFEIYCAYTVDNGQTWSTPVLIANNTLVGSDGNWADGDGYVIPNHDYFFASDDGTKLFFGMHGGQEEGTDDGVFGLEIPLSDNGTTIGGIGDIVWHWGPIDFPMELKLTKDETNWYYWGRPSGGVGGVYDNKLQFMQTALSTGHVPEPTLPGVDSRFDCNMQCSIGQLSNGNYLMVFPNKGNSGTGAHMVIAEFTDPLLEDCIYAEMLADKMASHAWIDVTPDDHVHLTWESNNDISDWGYPTPTLRTAWVASSRGTWAEHKQLVGVPFIPDISGTIYVDIPHTAPTDSYVRLHGVLEGLADIDISNGRLENNYLPDVPSGYLI